MSGPLSWALRSFVTGGVVRRGSVPVTVLSGFLGAGKTTLVNHILTDKQHAQRVAVLVNDMAEINIDADLLRDADKQGMVQLENGCICCTLREDLVIELAALARQGGLDHIVVESTGVSEPHPVAQTFSMPIAELRDAVMAQGQTDGQDKAAALAAATAGLGSLQEAAHLHSLVTVVDCASFMEHVHSIENLEELGMASMQGDTRPLSLLLMEQVQFANLLLLNKTDLVTLKERQKVEQLLRLLNPSARVVPTRNCEVDASALLAQRAYNEKQFSSLPAWEAELSKGEHSEVEEYGIKHFTLRELGRPLHAERFYEVLRDDKLFSGVLRAKGCFWTREDPNSRVEYSHVGHTSDLIVSQMWAQAGLDLLSDWARLKGSPSVEEAAYIEQAIERFTGEADRLRDAQLWDEVTHDRRVELVFIGDQSMQEDKIRQRVEAAMLTDDEFDTFLDSWEARSCPQSPVEEVGNPFVSVPRCVSI